MEEETCLGQLLDLFRREIEGYRLDSFLLHAASIWPHYANSGILYFHGRLQQVDPTDPRKGIVDPPGKPQESYVTLAVNTQELQHEEVDHIIELCDNGHLPRYIPAKNLLVLGRYLLQVLGMIYGESL